MKMQKILIDGVSKIIEELLDHFTEDDEIDFDNLGACMDSNTLDRAIESFDKAYGMFELIERYLQLADKPIEVTT
jgi:hypothetical protein